MLSFLSFRRILFVSLNVTSVSFEWPLVCESDDEHEEQELLRELLVSQSEELSTDERVDTRLLLVDEYLLLL